VSEAAHLFKPGDVRTRRNVGADTLFRPRCRTRSTPPKAYN
jgi:hypothetical protein